jgi:hypothetical protein
LQLLAQPILVVVEVEQETTLPEHLAVLAALASSS